MTPPLVAGETQSPPELLVTDDTAEVEICGVDQLVLLEEIRDWSLRNGKFAGPKLFAPPPPPHQDRLKL